MRFVLARAVRTDAARIFASSIVPFVQRDSSTSPNSPLAALASRFLCLGTLRHTAAKRQYRKRESARTIEGSADPCETRVQACSHSSFLEKSNTRRSLLHF
jgi:hypothetical protein